MEQDLEEFLREQEIRARRDLTEGTTLDDDEIEEEVRRQMRDLRETYE